MKSNKNKKEKMAESAVKVLIRVRPMISIEKTTKNVITIGSNVYHHKIQRKSVAIKVD